jgi:hypothetical protein
MIHKVSDDQFEVKPNEVVHLPTGARFTSYPGERLLRHAIWNDAGLHPEFRKLDIFNAAKALIGTGVTDHVGPTEPVANRASAVASESLRDDEPVMAPKPIDEPAG